MTRWDIGFSYARPVCLAISLSLLGCSSGPPQADPSDRRAGRDIYLRDCASCHGLEGAGDGPIAGNSRIHPRNLRRPQDYRQGTSSQAIYLSIKGGVRGTVMTPWEGRLNELELRQVAAYVRSLHPQPGNAEPEHRGGSPSGTPTPATTAR